MRTAEQRQTELLTWLRQHAAECPGERLTTRRLRQVMGGIGQASIVSDLQALRAAGHITYEDGKSGTLRVVTPKPPPDERPLPHWRRWERAKYSGER